MVKSLRFGELAANSNSPIFIVLNLGELAVILCIHNVCVYSMFHNMYLVFVLI